MTYAAASLTAAMKYWVSQGGVNLGIVGDAAHAARPTYHNGWDRAVARYGTSNMSIVASKDYSFRLPRDQVKSNAAMGMDLGKLDGTYKAMRDFASWLVGQCEAKAPGTNDIREIIWSPDGVYVKRWSWADQKVIVSLRKNTTTGAVTVVNPGQGDASHYSHTHISFFRDSEARSKLGLFEAYFAGDVMKSFRVPERSLVANIPTGTWLNIYSDLRPDAGNVQLNPGRALPYIGRVDDDTIIVAYEATVDDANTSSPAMFCKDEGVTFKAAPGTERIVEVPTGITEADVATARKEAGTLVAQAAAAKAAEL